MVNLGRLRRTMRRIAKDGSYTTLAGTGSSSPEMNQKYDRLSFPGMAADWPIMIPCLVGKAFIVDSALWRLMPIAWVFQAS